MILRGYFRSFNFFDIAEAIDLDALRARLSPAGARQAPAFAHLTPEYAQAQNTPVVAPPSPFTLPTGEEVTARIKYYWFGVAGVEFSVPFECEFDSLPRLSYRWISAPDVEAAAEGLLRSHLESLRPALIRPSPKWLDEDYLIVDIESATEPDGHSATAPEMLGAYADSIAQIIRGELASLSADEREEVVKSAVSYYPTDLLVVGWAAALAYDKPDATPAVIDILEYANTQLLEFRYYDELLTNVLSRVYGELEGRENIVAAWRLSRRAGRLNRIRLDIMDLAERTDYAVKFISDTYYARVYRISSARIGVNDYRDLVDDKLKTAGELYDFMVAQFNERRMFALEVVVAFLILVEFIILLRQK